MNDTTAIPRAPGIEAPNHPMFALIRAARILEARLEVALETAGLSMPKLGVLQRLAAAGEDLTLSELAERRSCVRSNMTQLIDRLESDGLVKRVADSSDRRSVRASLTASGREREADGTRIVKRIEAEFAASLPAADRNALDRVLSTLR